MAKKSQPTRIATIKYVSLIASIDLTIGRPWWEEKSVDHSEEPKTRVQDTVIDGLITRILLKIKLFWEKLRRIRASFRRGSIVT
jgi:hypothetical protein